MKNHKIMTEYTPLSMAVTTVSNNRDLDADSSGQLLTDKVTGDGGQS